MRRCLMDDYESNSGSCDLNHVERNAILVTSTPLCLSLSMDAILHDPRVLLYLFQ